MDTSVLENDTCLGYVSCIKVDGRSILPPLMSESRRNEMRHYREIAATREARRREIHQQVQHTKPIPSPSPIKIIPIPAPRNPPQKIMSILLPKASSTPRDQIEPKARIREVTFFGENSGDIIDKTPKIRPRKLRTCIPYFDEYDGNSEVGTSDEKGTESESTGSRTPPLQTYDSHFIVKKQYTLSPGQVSTSTNGESITQINKPKPKPKPKPNPDNYPAEFQFASLTLEEHGEEHDEEHDEHICEIGSQPTNEDEDKNNDTESSNSITSNGTFIIESSQSHSIMNASFLSEGEVVDDDDDLDEAANLIVRKKIVKDDTLSTISVTTNTTSLAGSSISGAIGHLGLSKLKTRIQTISPSLFKLPGDSRSPLLRGIIFLDPLYRPRPVKNVPPEALLPSMKPKFDRVTAAVKGYLVRRLLQTDKLKVMVQTIQDTVELLLNLYEETPSGRGRSEFIKSEDLDLHRRLIQQLNGACSSFHDVFFKLSTPERMAIISTDRTKILNKAIKGVKSHSVPQEKTISVATLRCIERRSKPFNTPELPLISIERAKQRNNSMKPPLTVQVKKSVTVATLRCMERRTKRSTPERLSIASTDRMKLRKSMKTWKTTPLVYEKRTISVPTLRFERRIKRSTPERKAIISSDRTKLRNQAIKAGKPDSNTMGKTFSIPSFRSMDRRNTIAL